jgi:hypothetical protein
MRLYIPISISCGLLLFSCITSANSDYGQYKQSQFSPDKQVVLVNWNSQEGKKRLMRSQFNTDFFQLAHHYQPQANPLYCGIASSVMVLNALRINTGEIPSQKSLEVKKPEVWGGDRIPYKSYSQSTLLNKETDQVKAKTLIELTNITPDNTHDAKQFDPGLTLAQLKGVLTAYQTNITLYYASNDLTSNIKLFRKQIKRILSDDSNFILSNYKSNLVGQSGGGHISPLAAYDEESDSVLVLDVSGHLNPWLWIPVKDLYLSMHTKDGDHYRGYLIIQEQTTN